MRIVTNKKLLEELSNLEHKQWIDWSKNISKDIKQLTDALEAHINYWRNKGVFVNKNTTDLVKKQQERLQRWEKLWIPYEELDEEMKESDREYARKVITTLHDFDVNLQEK